MWNSTSVALTELVSVTAWATPTPARASAGTSISFFMEASSQPACRRLESTSSSARRSLDPALATASASIGSDLPRPYPHVARAPSACYPVDESALLSVMDYLVLGRRDGWLTG